MGKERRIKPDCERTAIPLPEGIVDPEALEKSLETFAAEVRRRKFGLLSAKEIEEIAERQERERQHRGLYSAV